MNAVCVYCGSSDQVAPHYIEAARHMGEVMAARGLQLIFGGGSTGLMGAVADAVLDAGGEVIGVLPLHFNKPELAHGRLTRLELVDGMHPRKARMAELADAFVALPGGGLITGSFIIEWFFVIPGIGREFVLSINRRDYPLIMGVYLLYAFLIAVANLTVDLVYGLIDPRIRVSK